MTQPRSGAISPSLLLVLALLAALAPFGIDLYLPAFTRMTTDLATSATGVQLSLTAFLVGIAAGQLVFGPLSDRFGRQRPLLIGAAVCVAASVVAALAPSIEVLIGARLVQGLAGAAGMVIGRAIISDLARGAAAARAFSLMMVVGGIAPVAAPLLGSVLADPLGWRGLLWIVAGLAALMLVGVIAVVRETHTARRPLDPQHTPGVHGPGAAPFAPGARALLGRRYLGNVLALAFAFSVMMAYISASPFVYQVMIGLDTVQYGLVFGLNAVGLMVTGAVSARLNARFAPRRLLGVGIGLIVAASFAVLILTLTGAPVGLLPFPIFVAVSSLGFLFGNATAEALAEVRHVAGLGSAVLGTLQYTVAAAVSPLVSLAGEDSALPLAIVMSGCATVALVAYLAAGREPLSGAAGLADAAAR